MTLDEAIMKYKSNAEYEREHGSPAYLKSEQLCKWLEELRALKEQQRPKGHWILKVKGLQVTDYYCSECGRYVKDDTGYDVSKDYPFCHCGADMREVET